MKITLRNFSKNIIPSIIKILGLAISLSAVIIIWSFVINENKFDKGIPNSNRIYRLESNWASMPPFIGNSINQSFTNQVIATRLSFWGDVGVQVSNNPYNLKDLTFADSTFFRTFPLEFLSGDPQKALTLPFSMVLSEFQARRLFGNTDAIGKIVKMENQFDFTVTAILKDQPFLHFKTEVIASLASLEQIRYNGVLKEFDGWSYPTYLLFPEDVRTAEYEKAITELLKKAGYVETPVSLTTLCRR